MMMTTCRHRWSAGRGVLGHQGTALQHARFVGFSSQCGFFFFKLWGI